MSSVTDKAAPPAAKKALGQNFLVDPNIVRKIVRLADFNKNDIVVELGVGQGALTMILAQNVSKVIGLEKDIELVSWLANSGTLPENVEIMETDMLEMSYMDLSQEIGQRLKLIGNLPYNISSQLLFKIIDERAAIEDAVLMFQKEVAARITAEPGTKAYGILSVLVQECASVTHLMDVPPQAFRPIPKVISSVIRIRFKQGPLGVKDFKIFKALVKKAFQKRRKVLLNALEGFLNLKKEQIKQIMESCNINPRLRPEDLSVHDFEKLANKIKDFVDK